MSGPEFRPEVRGLLSAAHLRQHSVIVGWNLDAIRRRVMERMEWTPEFAEAVESEYRKFILLAAIDKEAVYGMAGPVDEFWHQHLLDTVDYHLMCSQVAGHFIHHVPGDSNETEQPPSYELTLNGLSYYFEEPSKIWPDADLVSWCGKGCSSCKSGLSFSA